MAEVGAGVTDATRPPVVELSQAEGLGTANEAVVAPQWCSCQRLALPLPTCGERGLPVTISIGVD
jgi:hypothetical protein